MTNARPRRRCTRPYCPNPARDRSPLCIDHARELDATYQRHRDVYDTPAWQALARHTLDHWPVCQQCHRAPSAHADHITPLERGGPPLDPTNVQALCLRCHGTKTADEVGLGRPTVAKIRPRPRPSPSTPAPTPRGRRRRGPGG